MENKNMKLKKFLKVLCVGVMCFGTLTTLTGCESEEEKAKEKRKEELLAMETFSFKNLSPVEQVIPLESKSDVKLDNKKYKIKKATEKKKNGALHFNEKTVYEFYCEGDNIKQVSLVSQITVKEQNSFGEKVDISDMEKVVQDFLDYKLNAAISYNKKVCINRGSVSYKTKVDGKTIKFYLKQDIDQSFKDYNEFVKERNEEIIQGKLKIDKSSYRGILNLLPFCGEREAFDYEAKTISLKKALKEIQDTNEYLGY